MNKFLILNVLSLFMVVLLTECNEGKHNKAEETGDFPGVSKVDDLRATSFVAVVSSKVPESNNVIYTPTFLFAWEKMENIIGLPIKLINPVNDLTLINEATSFKNALSKDECNVNVVTEQTHINISASFKKSLPFREKLDVPYKAFTFNRDTVQAFGMPYYSKKIAEYFSILFYKSDDEFIIKVTPKNEQQEIIIAKGFNQALDLQILLDSINDGIRKGVVHKAKKNNKWKYILDYDDQVIIPVLKFNLEKEFVNFIPTIIKSPHGVYTIDKASQRTAFVLDENGTKVEAVAEVAVAAAVEAPPSPDQVELKHPKLLWFNKPFVVMLRKKGVNHPYLIVKVMNTELMVKQHMKE